MVASSLLQRKGQLSADDYLSLNWLEEGDSPPESASPEEVAVWKMLKAGPVIAD